LAPGHKVLAKGQTELLNEHAFEKVLSAEAP